VEFGLLGPLLVRSGEAVVPVAAARQRVVLAALLLGANRVVPADELADFLWGDYPPPTARATMQNYVKRLRRTLGDVGHSRIVTRPRGYLISVATHELDLTRFEALQAQARDAARRGEWPVASSRLHRALALWRDRPLADVPCDRLEVRELPRLDEMRVQALEARADADLHLGLHGEMLGELAQLVAAHPLRERLRGLLMLALYRAGRQGDALAAYRQGRQVLVRDLGVEPGPELRRLHQQILTADPGLDLGPTGGNGYPASPAGRRAARQEPTAVAHAAHRPAVPGQLPAAVAHFVGRAGELRMLSGLAEQAGRAGGTVVVSAIGGTPGVGKTALAVHWAHQVADRFPDGQLYVNLRTFGPSGGPVTAAEAVRGFLDALAIPQNQIPAGLDAQAGLYRSILAGKRMLVVLDNADDEQQVRPLLPGAPGCMVLVTSRNQLSGLTAIDCARPLTLEVMSETEAEELLARRLGAERVGREPEAVSELAGLCARLPLALAVVAARAAARPGMALCDLAAQLRDRHSRLDVLDAADPASSLRAVFSWSCQGLSGPAARMFRLLGIHPGPDITVPAAASLADIAPAQAARVLAELTGAHLLTEHTPGRFTFHDLLRGYATERAHAEDSHAERHAATHRALDHYLHTTWSAARQLHPGYDPMLVLSPPQPGTRPETIRDSSHALAWCQSEHQVLLAVITQAAATRFDTHAWQLPRALTAYFSKTGCWADLAATQRTALAAARRLNDRAGQARAHHDLSCVRLLVSPGKAPHKATHKHLTQALSLYQELGDQAGQACVHLGFTQMFESQHRPGTALRHAQQVLRLARAIGRRSEEAYALNAIGRLHAQLRDDQRALACCREALALHRDIGDRSGEAASWDSLGCIRHHLGQLAEAVSCYQHAVQLRQQLGNRCHQAVSLDHLGDAHDAAGDPHAARGAWQQALDILDDLHHRDASQVRRKLLRQGVNHSSSGRGPSPGTRRPR
jgi:DNA-binding SARP family transcriptional activator